MSPVGPAPTIRTSVSICPPSRFDSRWRTNLFGSPDGVNPRGRRCARRGSALIVLAQRAARIRTAPTHTSKGNHSHDQRCAAEGGVLVRRSRRDAAWGIREDRRGVVAARRTHDFRRRQPRDRSVSHQGWHRAHPHPVARRPHHRRRDTRPGIAFRRDGAGGQSPALGHRQDAGADDRLSLRLRENTRAARSLTSDRQHLLSPPRALSLASAAADHDRPYFRARKEPSLLLSAPRSAAFYHVLSVGALALWASCLFLRPFASSPTIFSRRRPNMH